MTLLVAGCGDGGSEKASDSSSGGSGDSARSGEADSGGASEKSERGGDEEFDRLTKLQKRAKYKVTYEISSSGTGEQVDPQVMTFAVDGTRTAIETDDALLFQLDDGLISCSVDGEGGSPTCIQLPDTGDGATSAQLGALAGQFGAANSAFAADEEGVRRVDDETIAGRDASCWRFEYNALGAGVEATSCLDKQTGAPLALEWGAHDAGDASSTFESRATEFGDVSEDDFTPPAEPLDLGELQNASPEDQQKMLEQMAGGAGGQ